MEWEIIKEFGKEKEIKVSRTVSKTEHPKQLHIFCDESKIAYGAEACCKTYIIVISSCQRQWWH